MPLTFIDIERQKNWRIALFFLVLLSMYFAITAVLASSFYIGPPSVSPQFWIFTAGTALIIAGAHFWSSAGGAVGAVIRTLNAQPPDARDDVHKTLMNVMEEIHVVTGNRRKIQCTVVPSLSLNALAAADLSGDAVIAITEGLLSRLTRPQLEAVMAHEAHHVLSGDCLEATVAASLFGTFSAVVEKLGNATRGRAFSSPAFLLAWIMLKLSNLLNLFISREREYRADAASVRMTRNPIALAETLHLLSRSWRGAGFIGSGFEMLCIVNPLATALDETEGFWADLLSTHPPIRKRMNVLLAMARVSVAELDAKAARREKAKKGGTPPENTAGTTFFAMSPQQQWQGPFTAAELAGLPWLSPLTWITGGDGQAVDRAWKEASVNAIFAARLVEKEKSLSNFICPSCRQSLVIESYTGTQVYQCRFCAGALVESVKIPRILARNGEPAADRVKALTRTVLKENQARFAERKLKGGHKASLPLLPCPRCKNPMFRGFYSLAYMIELDRCGSCGLTWFDRDELEMLQYMVENRVAGETAAAQ